MKLNAVFLSLAGIFVAGASLAEPALPKDWVAGKPGLQEPSNEKPGEDASPEIAAARQPPRRAVRARAIDIDTLPVVPIAKGRPVGEIPKALPAGSAADVVVLNGGGARRLNVAGFAAGVLSVGRTRAFFGQAGLGGISDMCGSGSKGLPIMPISYKAIRRADAEGAVEFVVGRGFLETSSCRVAIEERWSVRPARMAGGVILGFRARCDACAEGARETLHVLTPQLSSTLDRIVPLEHHTFSLEKGASRILRGFTGSSFSLLSFKVPEWSEFSDYACPSGQTSCGHSVRIEVSRAEHEPKATVTVLPNIAESGGGAQPAAAGSLP